VFIFAGFCLQKQNKLHSKSPKKRSNTNYQKISIFVQYLKNTTTYIHMYIKINQKIK